MLFPFWAVLLLLAPAAFATADPPCPQDFARVAQAEAESGPAAEFTALQGKKVREIFPGTKIIDGKEELDLSPATKAAFQKHFDDYWNTRVASGKVPKRVVKGYRAWLKKNGSRYPQLNEIKAELDKYKYGTMGDLLDRLFLKYAEEETELNPATVAEFLDGLDQSTLANLSADAKRIWKAFPKFFLVIGVQLGVGAALKNKELMISTHLWSYKVRHKAGVQEAEKGLGELDERLLPDWDKTRYAGRKDREEVKRDFLQQGRKLQPRLQQVFDLANIANPDFSPSLEQGLTEHMLDLKETVDRLGELSRQAARLKAAGATRRLSQEEQEQLSLAQVELGRRQEEARTILADWLVYTYIHKPQEIRESLALTYTNALNTYLEHFDVDQLRDATTARVRKYLGFVEGRGGMKPQQIQ